ncbi:MAG: hypothetical protein AB1486_01545 [Planctomycetota bacterium]
MLHGYDADGRLVKTDGAQLKKFSDDGLGRQKGHFILSRGNHTAYADADDVTGDSVLEERQTTDHPTDGRPIMMARIDRIWDDVGMGETTGHLNTNADTDPLKYTAANLVQTYSAVSMFPLGSVAPARRIAFLFPRVERERYDLEPRRGAMRPRRAGLDSVAASLLQGGIHEYSGLDRPLDDGLHPEG